MANLEFDTIRLSQLKRKNAFTFDVLGQGVRIIGQARKGGATRVSVERAPAARSALGWTSVRSPTSREYRWRTRPC